MRAVRSLYILPIIALVLIVSACASIGRPQGGPIDEDPPKFTHSNPMPGELNVNRTNFAIYFDENVQLEDAFSKVVVSPVQIQSPSVSANGKRVSVELKDTLIPGVTYTIDFGDAIKDLNEGNILDGFALDFSTGDRIDTLRISGLVLDASNLEPAQGITVGAYSNLNDSAIHTLAPDRIARTNQLGQFTIRNLAPGSYRIYALNDLNRDWHWDRSEDVAFLDTTISPSVEEIVVTDTLYDSQSNDSLISRPGIRYLPNDVLLTWFNQNYRAQYLKDYKRLDRRRATVILAAPPDSLPEIRVVGGVRDSVESSQWAIHQYTIEKDSLTLWFTDTLVMNSDSLQLAVKYRKPDSLDNLQWTTDTLRFFFRDPEVKKKKKDEEADTIPPRFDLLNVSVRSGTSHNHFRPLTFSVDQPIAEFDTTGVHLEMLVDTVWQQIKNITITPDSLDPILMRHIYHDWEPEAKYRFVVDSAALVSIYGEHNPPYKVEMTVKPLEDYSNLTMKLVGADSTAVVELLNSSDQPVRSVRAVNGDAIFRFVDPGTYYVRMFFDANGDGRWTTGILDSIQPEEVAYYPKKLNLKKNWDIEQPWDIYEIPVDKQKPYAILKNKPKLKRGEKPPVDPDEENSEEDDFLDPGNQRDNNRGNNRGGGLGGFGGGFKKTNL